MDILSEAQSNKVLQNPITTSNKILEPNLAKLQKTVLVVPLCNHITSCSTEFSGLVSSNLPKVVTDRTKQKIRTSTGGEASHKNLGAKVARTLAALTDCVKNFRPYQPCTVPLGAIRRYQTSTELSIPKLSFQRLVPSVPFMPRVSTLSSRIAQTNFRVSTYTAQNSSLKSHPSSTINNIVIKDIQREECKYGNKL
uniref:Uncharacterized protein n=1 Tax=Glossina morsitans morsitans TaxID=37546 RepID=A0A1B0GBB2_GLOMM